MENTLKLKVDNITFLVERLGNDCHPLQFLRELTQNSIEAILRTPEKRGNITWDYDENYLSQENRYKLCIVDTGIGMTGEEMIKYLGHLSSSNAQQSMVGNYGVGAKITAAMQNPHGVLYLSWKEGNGEMIHLWKDPSSGEYGLKQYKRPDGSYAHYIQLVEEAKPANIKPHGTKVVLLGKREDDETISPLEGAPSPAYWVTHYLNSRYFAFPEGIVVQARESHKGEHSQLRTITGMKHFLDSRKESSGNVKLSQVTVHWWILKDQADTGYDASRLNDKGHVAALYQNELYDLHAKGKKATRMLQLFGVIFGYKKVFIYVEPHLSGHEVTTDTSRSHLKINGEGLPWDEWAAEFRSKMPLEIEELQQRAISEDTPDRSRFIQERLKTISDLLRISRYRFASSGKVCADQPALQGNSMSCSQKSPRSQSKASPYSHFQKNSGKPAEEENDPLKSISLPKISWVRVKDGSREMGDLEDRAARFILSQNMLLVNQDFRVFQDLVNTHAKSYGDQVAVKSVAEDAAKRWFELCLIEVILGIRSLQNSKEWSDSDVETALSEESLTAALMSRYHVNVAIKRDLGLTCGAANT